MAQFYPEDISFYNTTQSEHLFFRELNKQLEDDNNFTVFYSVPWISKDNKTGRLVRSECDFLIFHKKYGYLTLELKGGASLEISNRKWILHLGSGDQRVLYKSPFEQANQSCYFFRNKLEEIIGRKFLGVYGSACVFPFYSIKDGFGPDGPEEIIIDSRDIGNLKHRLQQIFVYYSQKNSKFHDFNVNDLEELKKYININKWCTITQSSRIKSREELFKTVNRVQDNFILFIQNYKKAIIQGSAGTGKTWIAMKKALEQVKENKKTLFICYNRRLADFVSCHLPQEYRDLLEITHFHRFVREHLGEKVLNELGNNLKGIHNIIESRILSSQLEPYDVILIDEAQDFDLDWTLAILVLLKSDDSMLYVFYDPEQNIFNRDYSKHFFIEYPEFILTENLRNTSAIHKWAQAETGFGKAANSSLIDGFPPVDVSFSNIYKAEMYLKNLIHNLLTEQGLLNSQLTILSDRTIENSPIFDGIPKIGKYRIVEKPYLDISEKEINYYTVQSFKGMESDVIIFIQHDPSRSSVQYVAYTRARYLLFVVKIQPQ